jgi:hypothetical protein
MKLKSGRLRSLDLSQFHILNSINREIRQNHGYLAGTTAVLLVLNRSATVGA